MTANTPTSTRHVRGFSFAAMKSTLGNVIKKIAPENVPPDWEKKTDPNGKTYYVDPNTGEMYRVENSILGSSAHKRINTDEKMTIAMMESETIAKEAKERHEEEQRTAVAVAVASPRMPAPSPPQNVKKTDGDVLQVDDSEDEESNSEDEKRHEISEVWACWKCSYENPIALSHCEMCEEPKQSKPPPSVIAQSNPINNTPTNPNNNPRVSEKHLDITDNDKHRRMTTDDRVNAALNQSLEETADINFSTFDPQQQVLLKQFLSITDSQPQDAIAYLEQNKWQLNEATDAYFHKHPESGSIMNNEVREQVMQEMEEAGTKKRSSVNGTEMPQVNENNEDSEDEHQQETPNKQENLSGLLISNEDDNEENDHDNENENENEKEPITVTNTIRSDLGDTMSNLDEQRSLDHTKTISVGHVTAIFGVADQHSNNRGYTSGEKGINVHVDVNMEVELTRLRDENHELYEKLQQKDATIEKLEKELGQLKTRETELTQQNQTYQNEITTCQNHWDQMVNMLQLAILQRRILSVKELQPMIAQLSELRPMTKMNDKKHLVVTQNTKNAPIIGRRLSYGGVGDLFADWADNQPEPSYVGIVQLFLNEPSDSDNTSTDHGNASKFNTSDLLHMTGHGKNEISFGGVNEFFIKPGMDLWNNDPHKTKSAMVAIPSTQKASQGLQKIISSEMEQTKTGRDSIKEKAGGKEHARGPSFGLHDVFRSQYSDDEPDDNRSTSPPEEDYFAISAYYDLEDGWDDSRRSSFVVGDHGRVVSRRISQRQAEKFMSELKVSPIKIMDNHDFDESPIIREDDDEEEEKNESKIYPKGQYQNNKENEQNSMDKNKYQVASTPDGHISAYPSTTIPLALCFDLLVEKSPTGMTMTPQASITPNLVDVSGQGARNSLHFKEESNDEKQVPITEEINTIKSEEEAENKLKIIKEQLRKEIKEECKTELYMEIKNQLYTEIKVNVEQEIKKQYEDRIRNEEAEFKNETLGLEQHIKELKQNLINAELYNTRLAQSKMTLAAATSHEIDTLREIVRQMGKLYKTNG